MGMVVVVLIVSHVMRVMFVWKITNNKGDIMAVQILWTHQEIGQIVEVMAIAKVNEFAFPMSVAADGGHTIILGSKTLEENRKEAFDIIKERLKPTYYNNFKLNYELKYVESDSEEWYQIHDEYIKTISLMTEYDDYKKLPWYKKLFYKRK